MTAPPLPATLTPPAAPKRLFATVRANDGPGPYLFGFLGGIVGLFAGAMTSTPTLQAAIDAVGNRDPAIGYSVAYPFGVIGPILCLFVLSRVQ